MSRRPSRAVVRTPERGAGRPSRARSSPRDGGDGGTDRAIMDGFRRELEELRRQTAERDDVIEHLQEVVASRNGAIQQLQAEIDDVVRRGPDSDPPEAGAAGAGARAENGEVAIVGTVAPSAGAGRATVTMNVSSGHIQQVAFKEDLKAWRNPAAIKPWLITTERPPFVGMSKTNMQAALRSVAHVSAPVVEMLNNLSDFDMRMFVPNGDDTRGEGISLPEHLEILIEAIQTIISKGVMSDEGLQRVEVLVKGLDRGLKMLRRHCNEFRSKLRSAENYDMMAGLVNDDLNCWAGELFDAATTFAKIHVSPPTAAQFPAVVTPAWPDLTAYVNAGGLRNLSNQPQQRQSSTSGSGKSKAATAARKGGNQYCFAFNSEEGCRRSARDCRWVHAIDPNTRGGKRAGGRGKDAYGSGGGSKGGRGDGTSGSSTDRGGVRNRSSNGGGGRVGGGAKSH